MHQFISAMAVVAVLLVSTPVFAEAPTNEELHALILKQQQEIEKLQSQVNTNSKRLKDIQKLLAYMDEYFNDYVGDLMKFVLEEENLTDDLLDATKFVASVDTDGDGFTDAVEITAPVRVNGPIHVEGSLSTTGLFVSGTSFLGAADDGDPSKVVIVEGGSVYATTVLAKSFWLSSFLGFEAVNLEAGFGYLMGILQDLGVDFDGAAASLFASWFEAIKTE